MHRYFVIAVCVLVPVHGAFAELSWYLGGGGTYATYETTNFAESSGIEGSLPSTDSITTGQLKDSPIGWQVYGGLMFTENFGVAVKYLDSGKAKDQWGGVLASEISPGPPPITTDTDLTFDGELSTNGVIVYFVQTVPMSEKVEFSIELGFTAQDVDFEWRETSGSGLMPSSGKISSDDTGFALGALARYKFVRNIAIAGEIEYATINFGGLIDRPLRFSLNAEIHF